MNKAKSQKVKKSSLNKNEISITGNDDVDDIIYYYKSKAEHAVNFDNCIRRLNEKKQQYEDSCVEYRNENNGEYPEPFYVVALLSS